MPVPESPERNASAIEVRKAQALALSTAATAALDKPFHSSGAYNSVEMLERRAQIDDLVDMLVDVELSLDEKRVLITNLIHTLEEFDPRSTSNESIKTLIEGKIPIEHIGDVLEAFAGMRTIYLIGAPAHSPRTQVLGPQPQKPRPVEETRLERISKSSGLTIDELKAMNEASLNQLDDAKDEESSARKEHIAAVSEYVDRSTGTGVFDADMAIALYTACKSMFEQGREVVFCEMLDRGFENTRVKPEYMELMSLLRSFNESHHGDLASWLQSKMPEDLGPVMLDEEKRKSSDEGDGMPVRDDDELGD